jgi:hypothetical protein
MAREYTTKPARLLTPTRNHLRTSLGDDGEVRQLGRSYLARPIYPIICNAKLEIADGNRRHAGVMQEKPDAEVPVCITDELIIPASLIEIQVESAAHTRGLSDYEQYVGYTEWLALNVGTTAKELAARFHRNEGVLSKILSLSKGIQAVKNAAKEGLIGYPKWWTVCKRPEEEQAAALAEALNGATRDKLARDGRKGAQGGGKAASVKVSAIKVLLENGIEVIFRGEELSLAQAAEVAPGAVKELDLAIKHGHDARTFGALMRKRAKQALVAKAEAEASGE